MTPYWRSPAMAGFGLFYDYSLVYFNAQSRRGGNMQKPILQHKPALGHHIIQQITTLVLMNTQTLFLDKSVVTDRIDLQTGSQSNWP